MPQHSKDGKATRSRARPATRTRELPACPGRARRAAALPPPAGAPGRGLRRAGELGNLDPDRLAAEYGGVALSLVDALSTLAVMRNGTQFAWAVRWLSAHVRSRARPSAPAAL